MRWLRPSSGLDPRRAMKRQNFSLDERSFQGGDLDKEGLRKGSGEGAPARKTRLKSLNRA